MLVIVALEANTVPKLAPIAEILVDKEKPNIKREQQGKERKHTLFGCQA